MTDADKRPAVVGQVERPVRPVAEVPVHPRQGRLWANVRPRGMETPVPSYPLEALYDQAAIDAMRRERDELAAKYDELLVALHGIGRALGIDEADRSPYSITCGVLAMATRLAEIERQEPVALVLRSTMSRSVPWVVKRRRNLSVSASALVGSGADHLDPLYTRPAPAAAPDHCEDAREMVCATSVPDGFQKGGPHEPA